MGRYFALFHDLVVQMVVSKSALEKQELTCVIGLTYVRNDLQ